MVFQLILFVVKLVQKEAPVDLLWLFYDVFNI